MPRSLKVCSCRSCTGHDGTCPALVPAGKCPPCMAAAERQRGTAAARGYDARWARLRGQYLRRPEHMFCVLCGRTSTVADHYPISRRDLVEQGVRDPDAWRYLRPLCHECHSVQTALHQPGGWAARHSM